MLRNDPRCSNVKFRVGENGGKIYWDTLKFNEHTRGSLTAAICSEIALSNEWGLATVHDPMKSHDDNPIIHSLLSLVYERVGDGETATPLDKNTHKQK